MGEVAVLAAEEEEEDGVAGWEVCGEEAGWAAVALVGVWRAAAVERDVDVSAPGGGLAGGCSSMSSSPSSVGSDCISSLSASEAAEVSRDKLSAEDRPEGGRVSGEGSAAIAGGLDNRQQLIHAAGHDAK